MLRQINNLLNHFFIPRERRATEQSDDPWTVSDYQHIDKTSSQLYLDTLSVSTYTDTSQSWLQ